MYIIYFLKFNKRVFQNPYKEKENYPTIVLLSHLIEPVMEFHKMRECDVRHMTKHRPPSL